MSNSPIPRVMVTEADQLAIPATPAPTPRGEGEGGWYDTSQRTIDALISEVGCIANLAVLKEPNKNSDKDILAAMCTVFLGILSIKTGVQLFVADDETISSVSAIFLKYITNTHTPTRSGSQVVMESGHVVAIPADDPYLLLELLESENLPTTTVTNILQYIQLSILHTNTFVRAVQLQNTAEGEGLARQVLEFLRNCTVDSSEPFHYGNITKKEHGAHVYEGAYGNIQIGIPPETIKTSLSQGKAVPVVYVLPPRLFSVDAMSYGDIEFPIYFNFFIQKSIQKAKVTFVGSQDQLERIQSSFCESIFGPSPEHIYVNDDISEKKREEGYAVNFPAERNFLAFKDAQGQQPPLTHFASFLPWDEHGCVTLTMSDAAEGIIKVSLTKGVICFIENNEIKGILDTSYYKESVSPVKSYALKQIGRNTSGHSLPSIFSLVQKSPSVPANKDNESPAPPMFEPPVLGVTFIGTSHGFDPKGLTTGFIIWINGNGVLVDPPVQTTNFLRENGIHRRFVNKVILTHCHSDHDSGLIRTILEGEKIEVYTTKTIIESYKRKFNAITGIKDLGEYFIFRQVTIGDIIRIHGAAFEFDYAFHTIPTIRFKLSYCGNRISYSGDCYYNPTAYAKLVEMGVINRPREVSLRMFLFDADLIIHEAGIPPIHTDIADLNDLPSSIKRRMCIVHTSSIPPTVKRVVDSNKTIEVPVNDLVIPKTGVDNTITLPVGEYVMGYSKATRLFKIFCSIFYFRNLSPNRLYELFSSLEEESYREKEVIVKKGEECVKFYIIENGEVDIFESTPTSIPLLTLTCGEYFGESALQQNGHEARRSATVIARTACRLLVLHGQKFREIMQDKYSYKESVGIDFDLLRVQRYRPFVRDMISKSFLFRSLKSDQIESIASIIEDETHYKKGEIIIKQGNTDGSLFLIKDGIVELEKTDPDAPSSPAVPFMRLGPGDTFGEISLITGLPRTASAIAFTDAIILELKRDVFRKLINKFQNIRYNIISVVEQRIQETKQVDKHVHRLLSHPNLMTLRSIATSMNDNARNITSEDSSPTITPSEIVADESDTFGDDLKNVDDSK